MLRSADGVVTTSGCDVNTIPEGYTVPKMELVSKLQAAVLLSELQDFRVQYTEAGNAAPILQLAPSSK